MSTTTERPKTKRMKGKGVIERLLQESGEPPAPLNAEVVSFSTGRN